MAEEGRKLKIEVFRYNPQIEGDEPRIDTFEVVEAPGMTIFIVLNEIREKLDSSVQYDFICRAGICGSCGMIINGQPDLACRTLTSKFKDGVIKLFPLPGFELIGDLSVNTGKFMREMTEKIEGWIHDKKAKDVDFNKLEERMENEIAEEIYELDRCVECGCCIAACGTKRMREDFLGAVGFMKIARFRLDPRDKRTDDDIYEVIGDDTGVFGCMSMLGCEDFCPKDLPHQSQIASLRRKMVSVK